MKYLDKRMRGVMRNMLAVFTMAAFTFVPFAHGTAIAQEATVDNVDICHWDAEMETYDSLNVDVSSIIDGRGHGGDTMDIIPEFQFDREGSTETYAGMNWDAEGQATWNNDCIPPDDGEGGENSSEIINPSEGETVSGVITLEAVYDDDDGDDPVQWAVRRGQQCDNPDKTVWGNVDGHSDPFNWDGENFTSDLDTTNLGDDEYCFIFNPTEDEGDEDIRLVNSFFIDNIEEEGGSISGTKWNDIDGDGVMDGGEEPLSGWTIELIDGSTTTTTTTDENGEYIFTGLEESQYGVCEEMQAGWEQTSPTEGQNGTRVCDEGRTIGYDINLGEDEHRIGNDFGNRMTDGGDVGTTTIAVTKVIVNDDGGTATTTDFTLLVGDMEVESGVATSVDPGTYVVDEFGTSTLDYEASFSGDCDAEGNITIDEGEHLECVITNDDIGDGDGDGVLPPPPAAQCGDAYARVVLTDVSNQGEGNASSTIFVGSSDNALNSGEWFQIVDDGVAITDADIAGYEDVAGLAVQRMNGQVRVVLHGSQTTADVEEVEGYVEFSETVPTSMFEDPANLLENENNGTATGPSDDEIDDASELADLTADFFMGVNTGDDGFMVTYDEVSAEDCALITVNKVIINDNGGTATTTDFTLLVGSTEVESGVQETVEAGTYVVSEFGTSTVDYEATFSGDCDAEGNITLSEGEVAECTITNDDIVAGDQCVAIESVIVSDSETTVNGTSSVAVDNDTETEGNQVPSAWTADIDGATWIWSDAQNDGDAAPGTETFTRTFNWDSDATTTAILDIATDNTYSISVNGDEVASSSDEVNFTLLTQDSYDISAFIVNGTNTLEISVTNLDNGSDNPAGLLYSLELDGFECPVEDDGPTGDGDGGGSGGVINPGDDDDDDDGQVLGERTDVDDEDERDDEDEDFDFDFDFDDDDDGVVLGDVFPFLPSTGAGGASAASFFLPILLASGIAVLALARHRVKNAGHSRHDVATSIFDR